MIINQKILSIPPHLSVSWKQIASIHKEGSSLVVLLSTGSRIDVPNLAENIIEQIFNMHAQVLQLEQEPQTTPGMPLKFGFEGMENFGNMMQHSSEQSDSPDLPSEMLGKISNLAKALGMQDTNLELPEAEPHCNCPFCQIAKAMANATDQIQESEEQEEPVSEEDLHFRDWDISQEADKLYIVKNPLDTEEHYQVFLGAPVGCTCGDKNCEHIRAVLNS